MIRVLVSRDGASGLVAVGLVEPGAVLPAAVRVVEPAVAAVLEEMHAEVLEVIEAAWTMRAPLLAALDDLVGDAEKIARHRDRRSHDG